MKATRHFKKHKLTCRCSQQDGRRHSGPRGRSSCKCYYDDVRAQKAWRLFSVMNGQQQPAVTVHPPQCTSMANAISHFTVTHTQTFIQRRTQTRSEARAHTHTHHLHPAFHGLRGEGLRRQTQMRVCFMTFRWKREGDLP